MSEHDPLAKIDLSVVGAPPAPERFARGVLTRFDAMEAAIAAARHRRRRRLAWLASSVAAVAAIVVALVALWPSPPVSGSYSTRTPHHLAVAGVAADLGSGASVAWSVEGDRVTVEQRGDVTWSVPIGKHLRVTVAGVGSVEAQDTTLRVEARMNLIDRKSVAVATAVAATAIVVTVIHGRANVTSGGTEMTVKQGSSAVATAGKPPTELLSSASPVAAMIVYSGDEVWARTELADLENALDRLVLPPGSRVGAISYSTGSVLEVPLGPASDFTGKRLGDAEKYRDRIGSDMIQGLMMGMAELDHVTATKKVLVLVGDGNDSADGAASVQALKQLSARAADLKISLQVVVTGPRASEPSLVERVGLPFVDEAKVDVAQVLADATGGSVTPQNIPPSVLEELRVAGDKNIAPDDETKSAMEQAGENRIIGSFKICIDATGAAETVSLLKTTGFPAYDEKIQTKMHAWRYKPFLVQNRPVRVCTAVTFIYAQR